MPIFTATRQCISYEEVEVKADNISEARKKIEDDTPDVEILSENQGDYEISPGTLKRK